MPPVAAKEETVIGQRCSCAEEELVDASFSIGQAIREKAEIGVESRFRRHGMMRVRIERVVDRNASLRAGTLIGADDGIAASVSEYEIVAGNQCGEGIGAILLQ